MQGVWGNMAQLSGCTQSYMGVSMYTLRHGHADARDKTFFLCVDNYHNVKKNRRDVNY